MYQNRTWRTLQAQKEKKSIKRKKIIIYKVKTKKEVVRINGGLKEVITIKDSKGKSIHKIVNPLMVEFHLKDLFQIIIGSSILAIPVGFTEETWKLGEQLPMLNVIGFIVISILFISSFSYYNYYRNKLREHFFEFSKRVLSTYLVSFLVVAFLLTLIQKTPWTTDWIIAIKRVVIVSFPSSMSAAVADMVK